MVHPDDRERVERSYIAAARSNQPWEIVHRIIRPNGVQRIVQQQAMHIRDPGGAADAVIIGVVYDITERTAAEAEQARLQRELEQAQKDGGARTTYGRYCPRLQQQSGRYPRLYHTRAGAVRRQRTGKTGQIPGKS
ncbi:MAG: PAS domain-containing protein [Chromatiaceae bacterium]|nr:PAS domain-containing protein [Gammaproteobacteria bacterium]MCP5447983.1 PAS domain-containing protein [Chromatiaceae bacterium]